MRLDVLHLDAVCAAERLERADLVAHERFDLVRLERHRPASEADEVRVARLGADGDAGPTAKGDGGLHHPEVAGVEPAGQVRAGQVRDQPLIVSERPSPEALAEIGIQVHAAIVRPPCERA